VCEQRRPDTTSKEDEHHALAQDMEDGDHRAAPEVASVAWLRRRLERMPPRTDALACVELANESDGS
jgi:hypothetical protein